MWSWFANKRRRREKKTSTNIVQIKVHPWNTMNSKQTIETRVTAVELFIYIKIVNKCDLFNFSCTLKAARFFENDFRNPDDSCNLIIFGEEHCISNKCWFAVVLCNMRVPLEQNMYRKYFDENTLSILLCLGDSTLIMSLCFQMLC